MTTEEEKATDEWWDSLRKEGLSEEEIEAIDLEVQTFSEIEAEESSYLDYLKD